MLKTGLELQGARMRVVGMKCMTYVIFDDTNMLHAARRK